MNCATHHSVVAVAYCRTCGKPLCSTCVRDVRGTMFCEPCLAERVGTALPPNLPLPPAGSTTPAHPPPLSATTPAPPAPSAFDVLPDLHKLLKRILEHSLQLRWNFDRRNVRSAPKSRKRILE